MFGLSEAAPSCAVALRLDCHVEGIGVDPDAPPLVWEAWTAAGWVACDLERDETGRSTAPATWCSTCPTSTPRRSWRDPRRLAARPRRRGARGHAALHLLAPAAGCAGVHRRRHGRGRERPPILSEMLGVTEGVAGQRFTVSRTPVLPPDEALVVEVSGEEGWQPWTQVHGFADSGPDDRHFVLDAVTGTLSFGPPCGSTTARCASTARCPHGRRPRGSGPTAAVGVRGGTSARTPWRCCARRSRTSPRSATGSPRAAAATPRTSRTPSCEDRWRCAHPPCGHARGLRAHRRRRGPRGRPGPRVPESGGTVRVLLVPATGDGRAAVRSPTCSRRRTRCAGGGRDRGPPRHRRAGGGRAAGVPGLTVVAQLRSLPGHAPQTSTTRRSTRCTATSTRWSADADGTDGSSAGRCSTARSSRCCSACAGVDVVEDVRLFPADPVTGTRGEATRKVELEPTALVFCYDHQVRVTPCED